MKYFLNLIFCIFSANIQSFANSSSKEQLFYDAVRSEASGDYENAIQNYKEALRQATTANLHGNLANLYFKTNDYGRSVLHYNKALRLDQNNREFLSNLAYVSKIAQVEISNQHSSGYLNAFSDNFWKGFSALFFWLGLIIIAFLFFLRFRNKYIFFIFSVWISGFLLLSFVIYYRNEQMDQWERKVVALNPDGILENNSSRNVPLRRFAAKTSSANTSVRPGDVLIVDRSNIGELKSHTSPNEKNWLLVSTIDKRKKGWVLEEEIGWIIGN
tara:strand:+ start:875 stop:1690 length:816 start_codon:yes stop_codon:yes gene_type:complete